MDTTVRREIDVQFAVNTLGDLPDLGSLPLFEVLPEKWPKVDSRRLRLPELKRVSGIIRGGHKRAAKCLEMDAEGWIEVEAVLEYLQSESYEIWTLQG